MRRYILLFKIFFTAVAVFVLLGINNTFAQTLVTPVDNNGAANTFVSGSPVGTTVGVTGFTMSTNVALLAPVTATTVTNGAAANATDGNMGSKWGSSTATANSFYVDLGASYSLSSANVVWTTTDYASSYAIQVSANTTFGPNSFATTGGNGNTDTDPFTAIVSGRYVKLNLTARGAGTYYAVYEFQVMDNITYTLTSNPGAYFSIDAATGVVTANSATIPAGSYSIGITATSGSVSSSAGIFTVTVTAPAAPSATVTTLPTTCGGGSTKFTASGGSPAGGTYNWYLGATGGTAVQSSTSTTYTTNLTSATTLYVSYTSNGAESARTAVTAAIKDYPFTTQNSANGLISQYTFTGNANDVSGNGNTGTPQGGATLTTDRFGVTSNAYNFDGSSGYISTTNQTASPGPQVFTINMWFNTTTEGGRLIGFGDQKTGTSGSYDRHIYMDNAGEIIFGIYNGATETIQTPLVSSGGTDYADGTWHMVTASLSQAGMKLYMDGVLVASNTSYTVPQVYAGYWKIGYDNLAGWPSAPSDYYFTGQLDDIDIYNRLLTDNEVASLQGAEVTPVCVGGTLSFSANPAIASGNTYTWSGPNGFTSTAQNPTIANATAAATGNYSLSVKGSDGCISATTIYGQVNPLPDATFTAPNNAIVNTNTVLTLGTAYNAALYTYLYTIGDGSIQGISGNNFTIKWPTIGAKTVTLTVTSKTSGCTSTYTTTVNVSLDVTQANYAFSQPATLNTSTSGITTTLTDFPALVYIKEDALKAGTGYVQNCANNIQFPTGGTNGYDFAFTLNGSNTELFYQIQSYDATTGTLLAWVQIPSVSASSNIALTFYFGSKTPNHSSVFTASTWPTDYIGVYHFEEGSTSATVLDATLDANNATQANTALATGQIGGAYSFNGSTSQIITTSTSNNVGGSFTLSAWVKSTSFTGHQDQKVITNESSYSLGGYKMSLYGGSATTVYDEVETRANDGTVSLDRGATGGTALAANTWYYVQGVYDNSTGTFYSYLNGKLDRSMTGANPSGTNGQNLIMGSDFLAGNWFYGIIDECRVSGVAKSADWIKEEYYNQTNQTTYTTAGTTITTNATNAPALGNPGGAIVYTWTGAGGATNLTAASNWTCSASGNPNQVPPFDGTCSLIIPAGATPYPVLSANESIYGLTLGAGATISLGSYTLNVGCHIYNNATSGSILYGTTAATVNFNGLIPVQYFYGNGTATTSSLANLTLNNSAGGTLDITGGTVTINTALGITKGNILVDNAGGGALTLLSSATGTANVNTIPAGYTITGNVTAQRFFPGGTAGYRSYRLVTLPVNISNSLSQVSGAAYIDLHSLNAGLITAGPGSGFSYTTATKNPLMYLYDESRPQNFTAYLAGKNVGIYAMTGASTYKVTYYGAGVTAATVPTTTAQVPVGNSVQVYYVGPYVASPVLTATAPASALSTATGYLNQGTIATYVFSTGSNYLSYNPAINNTPAKGPGLNQLGNPYPSTIDLDSLYFDNKTGAGAIGPMFWELKQPGNTFVAYSGNHTSSTAGSSAYVASGQGFFVQAISTNSTLTFYEKDKVNVNIGTSTTPPLILSQRDPNSMTAAIQQPSTLSGLHLQIMQDTATYTQTGIYFNKSWNDKYSPLEDAVDLDGPSPKVYLSSYSSDGARLCINGLGDYTEGKVVKLYASATSSGTYTISLADINNISSLYNVFLRDHKLNDSVDLRTTGTYTFTINTGDTTTYGANRFDLVLERQAVPPYQLLTFTGQKVSKGVQLAWTALNPGNYTGYTLQKKNSDGTFSPIYTVQSNNSADYNYTDPNPVIGDNIYRLAQNDINGTVSYSSQVTIGYNNVSSNGYFSVYPNPATDMINILVNSTTATAANYTADIYNTSGMLMDHRTLNTYSWTEDISNYKEGVYIIALKNTNGDVLAKSKFIKTK